jgi:hypothetical protein
MRATLGLWVYGNVQKILERHLEEHCDGVGGLSNDELMLREKYQLNSSLRSLERFRHEDSVTSLVSAGLKWRLKIIMTDILSANKNLGFTLRHLWPS